MKPISDAASKCGSSQIITHLRAWCTNIQLQTVQQSEHIRGNGDSITQLNASIPDAYSIHTRSTSWRSAPWHHSTVVESSKAFVLPSRESIAAFLWKVDNIHPHMVCAVHHCVGRHGTCLRQPVPFTVWPPIVCAKRLLLRFGQKHEGYSGAVVSAVAQGILCGGDLLASCHWVTCLSTCEQ